MKKSILSILVIALLGLNANASGNFLPSEKELSSIATTFVVSAPFVITSSPFQMTTEKLKNDLIQVQGDAIIALDTGYISHELQSVVNKIRSEYQEDTMNASDIEVVEMVFGDI